jgi:hypothetical protein
MIRPDRGNQVVMRGVKVGWQLTDKLLRNLVIKKLIHGWS